MAQAPTAPRHRWALLEAITPARMGPDFRRLFLAWLALNTADGLLLAGAPLLAAQLTPDPFWVAAVAVSGQVPWLLLSLPGGALVDRWDRRRLMIGVNLLRVALLATLTGLLFGGAVNIAVLLVFTFLLGCAEVLSDTAGSTLLPLVVTDPADRGIANARTLAAMLLTNQLIGPTLSAMLFARTPGLPFALATACLVLAVIAVVRMQIHQPHLDDARERRPLLHEMIEGLRWIWANPPVRTLALIITLFNVPFGASWSVMVLYAQHRLSLSEGQYGLFLGVMGVGGLIGTMAYGRLEARFSTTVLMRAGLVLESLTHLAFALLTFAPAAAAVMFVFGMHAAVWGTTATTVKQRLIPTELFGRVNSAYLMGMVGSLVVGGFLGGIIGQHLGVVAVFWFGFVMSSVLTATVWASVAHLSRSAGNHVTDD